MLVIVHCIGILFSGVIGILHENKARETRLGIFNVAPFENYCVFLNSVKSVEEHLALAITYQKFSKSVRNSYTPHPQKEAWTTIRKLIIFSKSTQQGWKPTDQGVKLHNKSVKMEQMIILKQGGGTYIHTSHVAV